jgi:hypothetical protein
LNKDSEEGEEETGYREKADQSPKAG